MLLRIGGHGEDLRAQLLEHPPRGRWRCGEMRPNVSVHLRQVMGYRDRGSLNDYAKRSHDLTVVADREYVFFGAFTSK